MKLAILLGRGVEGCGVTRYALETYNWFTKNGHDATMYGGTDKLWHRNKAQAHNVVEYKSSGISELRDKFNNEYDVVIYLSLPSQKSNSLEYREEFYNELVLGVDKPLKFAIQCDHKSQSFMRNSMLWETMTEMNGVFTHSIEGPFGVKFSENVKNVPLIKMDNGFDFDSLVKFRKPIESQIKRISYFGRFATCKDPGRITDMQPVLEKYGFLGEMRGVERSIGSLHMYYTDPSDRENTYRHNVYEVKDDLGRRLKKLAAEQKDKVHTPDKIWIWGPYIREQGLEELSKSMFGADFFHVKASSYGGNLEYAMCEIIAVGCIPVFDIHWAENCHHISGTLFADIKDFALYSDRNDHESLVKEMEFLANNPGIREARRLKCLEIAKEHCSSDVSYNKMLNEILKFKA